MRGKGKQLGSSGGWSNCLLSPPGSQSLGQDVGGGDGGWGQRPDGFLNDSDWDTTEERGA